MNEKWVVGELTDKKRILAFLETDRLYAAYAIGDLEPHLFRQCAWVGAEKEGRPQAISLQFGGLEPPAYFLMGDPPGLKAILGSVFPPARAYLTCRAEHLAAVQNRYRWDKEPDAMWRMVLRKERFPTPSRHCVRLTTGHADEIQRLILEGGTRGFASAQIGHGIFYGVFQDGHLVSAAGTHMVSPTYGVAAIGNVVTHRDSQGRGLGTAVVGAVAEELLRLGIRDIVLNTREDNAPAIRLYEKLGFERYCAFYEGLASDRAAARNAEGTGA
jgi:ribosomal protein S18 acetylase RimI-like enzyme